MLGAAVRATLAMANALEVIDRMPTVTRLAHRRGIPLALAAMHVATLKKRGLWRWP